MTEALGAGHSGITWSGWVGESTPVPQSDKTKVAGIASVATVLLLWLSSAVLIGSGYLTTVNKNKEVSDWILVGLAVLSLVVIGLVLVSGASRLLLGLAVVFGLVLAGPWALAGLLREEVETDGSVVIVIALVVVAVIGGSAVTPPHWLRLSVLAILLLVVWVSLALAIVDLRGADFGALKPKSQREFLGLPQVRGLLGHPNTMALVASFATVVSLKVTRTVARSGRVAVVVSAVVLGPTAAVALVLLTQSRIGLATLAVGLVLVLLPLRGARGRVWSYALMGGLFAASGVLLYLVLVTPLTFHGRAIAWQIAEFRIRENPLVGVGPDAFLQVPPEFTSLWAPGHAHSTLLQVASFAGFVGLALLALAAVTAAVIAVRAREFDHSWSFGVVGVFATYSWLEPALGVAEVPVTFLPVVLAAAVLGSAYTLTYPWAGLAHKPATVPRSPDSCEV